MSYHVVLHHAISYYVILHICPCLSLAVSFSMANMAIQLLSRLNKTGYGTGYEAIDVGFLKLGMKPGMKSGI